MEQSLSKFMAEYAKRHEENSNLIKEIRASTHAAIRNQGALIKALENQIRQMGKVLQEKGSRNLPGSTKSNSRDHVKSISTTVDTNTILIRRIGLADTPRLYDDYYDEKEGSCRLKNFDAYSIRTTLLDDAMPPKEKDPGKRMELDLEARIMREALILNRSLDPLYRNYIELNDLNELLELRRNQVDNLEPTNFAVVENMDAYRDDGMGDIIVGRPFCRKTCVLARRAQEMLDQTFDRLQKLMSHLELLDEKISQEDVNQNLLRSLSPKWNTRAVVWRSKADLDTMSMDDLYNNLKVYELNDMEDIDFDMVIRYIGGLESVEEKLEVYKANESIYGLKFEIHIGEIAIRELRKKLEIVQKEKDGIQLNVDKFEHASKSLNMLIDYQIVDNCKKVNTARQVNAAHSKTTVNAARPMSYLSKIVHSTIKRPIHKNISFQNSNINQKVNTVRGKKINTARPKAIVNVVKGDNFNVVKASACWGNPQMDLQDQGVIDSGCSRHMTGNMSYLIDYEEIDGGYVAFGGNPKGGKITGKCTIKTGNLDFENVYFVRELKFNLFSVSQICDKKNSVLFNDTECIVLSLNFKLIDESQVLLRVPRKNNMYSVDLKNIVPKGGLTCLFAKATSDESKLWHRRQVHSLMVLQVQKQVIMQVKLERRQNLPPFSQDPNSSHGDGSKPSSDDEKKVDEDPRKESECNDQEKKDNVNITNNVNDASTNEVNAVGGKTSIELPYDPNMPALEDDSIFNFTRDDEDGGEVADMNNLDTTIQEEPKKVIHALKDPSWIEAMQEELLQFKLQEV
ncbi:hypothetical protein Tco_1438218 [Tanacetum coccineum]